MPQIELSAPGLATADDALHLTAMLDARAASHPERTFAEVKGDHDTWTPVSLGEFRSQVRAVAKGLMAAGVNPGDRVGVAGETSIEWSIVDFAIFAAGGVTVPIYPSSSASQFAWIIEDAGITVIAAQTAEHQDAIARVAPSTRLFPLDASGIEVLATQGARLSDADLDARTADVVSDDLATIIYTSGTTGRPKGAMLTHRNLVEHAANVELDPSFGAFVQGQTRVLLFLPLAHVFARFAMILALSAGSVIGYTPSHKTLAADLKSFRPTWMPLVPRVLETIYNRADTSMRGIKKTLFRWSATVARQYSRAQESGGPGAALKARYAVADRLVLGKIRELLGGQLGYVLAGGAKLTPEVGHFFRGMGVTTMQGYGLTETTAAATGTPVEDNRIGTVGRPIAGCSVTLADDGEILVKGVNLFRGYWNAPEATAEVMRGDWFATGDLGEVRDGALVITGRKKEILVLSSGKNVQPAVLEDSMRSHPAIQDSVVIGDGRHFVSAVIALDPVLLPAWLEAHDLPAMDVAEASVNEKVRELIGRAIAAANEQVSKAEAIKEYRIVPREFSEAREELTASLKVRRAVVLEHFADVVESIYAKVKPQASGDA
ncbi:AMP-dependent synthetase/ligase [Demequina activiva]|uniref:Long-chain-fatty-acid--CoA ligase n=1 Tax=Demequina activiva TaxID=1582364 RepID=A0A919UHA3_9MICO|nr:long-chain fatty acid--CoA ligase [Demequina activiva]GIG55194.1 long-chain-fatty-acid--CoA ligase [Demequina activiva]